MADGFISFLKEKYQTFDDTTRCNKGGTITFI